jgi:glycosyltransferase involved in cell wall biosynthesis
MVRVLLIAEAANPEWVSVPLVGWSFAQALSKIADVHLVTQIRNRDAIMRAGMKEGRDFTVVDNEGMAGPLYKLSNLLRGGGGKGWTTIAAFSSLAYYSFERKMWRQLGNRICAGEFDLVHRVTPLSPTCQSFAAKWLAKYDVPFVVGPLNGGVPWPPGFIGRQYAEREFLSHARGLHKLMPGYRSTRRYSTAIIVGSKHAYNEIPHWARSKCVYIPENGVDLQRFSARRTRAASLPLKAAFVGRLVPYKGADLLLEAAADFLKLEQLELNIIGDGPQRSLLETMVDQMGLQKAVHFHGWVPHRKVQDILTTCDFLALPSVREFGGAVVIESMALGVAPIVADYAGPAELVDEQTGIRVGFKDKGSLIEGMRHAIRDVVRAPSVLDVLGAAGRRKVLDSFTWEAKAAQVMALYREILSRKQKVGIAPEVTPLFVGSGSKTNS